MRVASNWDKCVNATHLADALRLLTDDVSTSDEDQDSLNDYFAPLITAAEYRQKLPNPSAIPPNGLPSQEWSERAVRELTRIEDKNGFHKAMQRLQHEGSKRHLPGVQ